MKKIVIIGGGATGTCILLNASRSIKEKVKLIIVDPKEILGLGKAYSSLDEENLLNVPAYNMGIFQHDPAHFEKWLSINYDKERFQYYPFVPRKIFGEYLQNCLKGIQYEHIRKKVVEVKRSDFFYTLKMDDNSSIKADFLVVATGYDIEQNIFSSYLNNNSSSRFLFPSEIERFKFPQHSKILIVGSGLTAIDIWKRLRERKDIELTMTSRHGLLPLSHSSPSRIKRFPLLRGLTPFQLLQLSIALYSTGRYEWQQIADEIRVQSRGIWACWSEKEKRQFIRYVKPYWEIVRHRIPAPIFSMLDLDIISKRLRIVPGKIQLLKEVNQKMQIDIKLKTGKAIESMSFDFVVLATGSPINQDLFKNKSIEGVMVASNGFGYINTGAPNIWFAGPSSKATYWEITAVPDIRLQALEIVRQIEKRLNDNRPLVLYKFLDHPRSINESYTEHMLESIKFSKTLFTKAFYSFIHAFFPYRFTDNTSNRMRDFFIRLSRRRHKDF